MKYSLLFISVLVGYGFNTLKAQEISVPKQYINTLSSLQMQGRGYINNGDRKAANYLREKFKEFGIAPLTDNYFQEYCFPINTFPGKMHISLDNELLKPVYDYVVAPQSKTRKGTYSLHYLPNAADTIDAIFDSIKMVDYSEQFLVANFSNRNLIKENPFKSSGVIVPKSSLFWWLSTGYYESETTLIMVADSIMKPKPKHIKLDFKNKFYSEYETQNVVGEVKGANDDSIIVFTAHYDHLGMMGKGNVFLGANDNASGTAMVTWLASYFAKPENKPEYTLAFLLFSGEEAGLHGSRYFTEHPLFNLDKVKALINLDMVGTGSKGIAVVNGKNNLNIFNTIDSINNSYGYFNNVKLRGESCSSDHCFFHKYGVPAVFIYTEGDEFKEYHNLDDIPDKLPLTKYNELFQLLITFVEQY